MSGVPRLPGGAPNAVPGPRADVSFRRPPALLRSVAVLLLAVAATACNDTPTAPTMTTPPGTVNVAGDWSGTWTYSTAGVMVTDDVTARLNQSGAGVTGTWTAASGATGQISFTAMATLSGNLTLNQALLGGGSCNGGTTISGSAAADRLDITLADIAPQGVCRWGTGGRFVLTR